MSNRKFYSIFGLAAELSATVAGLVLFSVGLTGLYNYTLNNTSVVIILLEPLGYGPMVDKVYWSLMMITGVCLTTLFWTRLFAVFALLLIAFKIVLLGYEP